MSERNQFEHYKKVWVSLWPAQSIGTFLTGKKGITSVESIYAICPKKAPECQILNMALVFSTITVKCGSKNL